MGGGSPSGDLPAVPPTPASVQCDLYASPSGSDSSGDGSIGNPFASVSQLDSSLSPGQTGCLRGGTYGDIHTWQDLSNSGASGAQITITSYPGETAKLDGWVDIEASFTTLSHVEIDGSNTFDQSRPSSEPSCTKVTSDGLAIAGHDDVFEYNDYYQSVPSLRSNGIGIGWWGDADNTIVRYNRIHDIGGCDFYDHFVYLSHGNNVQIYDNWMWDDPHGWGVKLDPGPTNARVWGNVIDGAGSGFNFGNSSGSDPTAGNQVFHNVVMNSVGVNNPDIGWGHSGVLVTSPGLLSNSTGNRVYDNDSYNNPGGTTDVYRSVLTSQLQITGTVSNAPQFADAANHDYRLAANSPVAGWNLWNGT